MASQSYSLSSTIKLNNGIQMPRIHLGVYMTSGHETSRAVTYALEAGYRAFDSAEWYANEREVGSAILKFLAGPKANKLKREDIWFTTKLKTNSSYDATRRKIKESIKECGLGYLDLYLLHSPYGEKQKRLECWRAVEDAIGDGEVRAGGVSNYGVKHVSIYALIPFIFVSSAIDDSSLHALLQMFRSKMSVFAWDIQSLNMKILASKDTRPFIMQDSFLQVVLPYFFSSRPRLIALEKHHLIILRYLYVDCH